MPTQSLQPSAVQTSKYLGRQDFLSCDPKPPKVRAAPLRFIPGEAHTAAMYSPRARGIVKGGGVRRMGTGLGHAGEDVLMLCWRPLVGQKRARARERGLGAGE